jgi:hypothetical protein
VVVGKVMLILDHELEIDRHLVDENCCCGLEFRDQKTEMAGKLENH